MKPVRMLTLTALCAMACLVSQAQDTFGPDSVMVTGRVLSRTTGEPEPFCKVELFMADSVRAAAMCGLDGEFAMAAIPSGIYGLKVSVLGVSLYKAEIELAENSDLNILVDTIRLVYLNTVAIVGRRPFIELPPHKLGPLLITRTDDPRLWNMSGQIDFFGPASADMSGRPRLAKCSHNATVVKTSMTMQGPQTELVK